MLMHVDFVRTLGTEYRQGLEPQYMEFKPQIDHSLLPSSRRTGPGDTVGLGEGGHSH